jgi:nitrite reductase/ring-hydroxylating ferredoxin subunit
MNGRRTELAGRFPFPGLPSGWYAVATSSELKKGQLLHRAYFNTDIILYRTESGVARVSSAFCPHMGANLGKVGRVEGETLVCGFHGFTFDGVEGHCVATSYGSPPPPRAKVAQWLVREQNGLILTWFDETGAGPTWTVPELNDKGWNKIGWRRFRIPTHPQETTENSVDFGHFTQIHGFTDGSITSPIEIDGPYLTNSYRAWRGVPIPSLPLYKLAVDYAVHVWGLGYSQVDVRVESLRFDVRLWVLPVPIDDEHIDLVLGASTPTRLGPLAPLARAIARFALCNEVEQDLDVWTYKTYLEQPALAKGDGAVAEYRRYVQQFYPQAGARATA